MVSSTINDKLRMMTLFHCKPTYTLQIFFSKKSYK